MCNFALNLAVGVAGYSNSSKDGIRMSDNTPEVLTSIGMEDLPVMVGIKHCTSAQNDFNDGGHEHGIPLSTLEQVPEAMKHPVFVFDSDKRRDTVVLVLDLYDPMNQPIMVCVHCNGDQDGTSVNYITGLYGKRQEGIFGQYLRAVKENRMLFVDQKAVARMSVRINKTLDCNVDGIVKQSANASCAKRNREHFNKRYS